MVTKLMSEPLWKGPTDNGPMGGVTQSLLSRFCGCREKFRIQYIEGLQPNPTFNPAIEYGNMWHLCEEIFAESKTQDLRMLQHVVRPALLTYARELCAKYPTSSEQIDHWYRICLTQFPIYIQYWQGHSDVQNRIPILQEYTFKIPYKLPTGRVVYLRGKWDAVELVGRGGDSAIWLIENKTKGEINEQKIVRRLHWDLQTMLYLTALHFNDSEVKLHIGEGPYEIRGVRYNVVRRPLANMIGKGNIRRKKATKTNPYGESRDSFYARLGQVIESDPASYFSRWNVQISKQDLDKFRRQCLDPLLQELSDWYECIIQGGQEGEKDPFKIKLAASGRSYANHYRLPYGIYLGDEGDIELQEYMSEGTTVGLQKVEKLFTELG